MEQVIKAKDSRNVILYSYNKEVYFIFYETLSQEELMIKVIKKDENVFWKQLYRPKDFYESKEAIEGKFVDLIHTYSDCEVIADLLTEKLEKTATIEELDDGCKVSFPVEVAKTTLTFAFKVKKATYDSHNDIVERIAKIEQENQKLYNQLEYGLTSFDNLEVTNQVNSMSFLSEFEQESSEPDPDTLIQNGYSLTLYHQDLFSKWVGRKCSVNPLKNAKSEEGGFSSSFFHDQLKGIDNLLVVIVANNNLFGGFSKQAFKLQESSPNLSDPSGESFLFNLTRNTQFKLNPNMKDYAIYSKKLYGPCFGSFLGFDLQIADECDKVAASSSDLGTSYMIPNRFSFKKRSKEAKKFFTGTDEDTFKVDNIEYYQLSFE